MQPARQYLRDNHAQPMPAWLAAYSTGAPFRRDDFFSDRVVYYPGSGTDGRAVDTFGAAHAAHCFVMVDYGIGPRRLQAEMDVRNPQHFRGYSVAAELRLAEHDLVPNGWRPHIGAHELPATARQFASVQPFALFVVLEREAKRSDEHGPARLAILFLGADGVATYDALFCQQGAGANPAPYAVMLQDHGFGGNYTKFGKGGLLEQTAARTGVYPQWLLVGQRTEAWAGYRLELDDRGSFGHLPRQLYCREA